MDNIKGVMLDTGRILVIVLCIIGFVWCVAQTFSAFELAACNQFAELNPTIKTQFHFFGGCYVQIDGAWIPIDQIKGMP